MPVPANAGQRTVLQYDWDFAVHGGTKDANITLATVPLNWVTTAVHVVCVTVMVGASGTFDVGHSTTPAAFFDDLAITTMDTVGKVQSVKMEDMAAATTAALRARVILINTTNQTAGCVRIYEEGFVADLQTGKKADTSY